MTKVLIVTGSPRARGNTNTLASLLAGRLEQDDVGTEVVDLSSLQVGPCTDCRGCKRGDLVCAVQDDMQPLYGAMDRADALVLGTPIYWYGPSAQMKACIDRLRPYFGNGGLAGKGLGLLLAAGSGPGDCDLTESMARRIADALQMRWLGAVKATAFDAGDVLDDPAAGEQLAELAARLG